MASVTLGSVLFATAAATAGAAAAGAFSGDKGGSVPRRNDERVRSEALKERRRRAAAIGRSKTILGGLPSPSGGQTLLGSGTEIGRKTLLGS